MQPVAYNDEKASECIRKKVQDTFKMKNKSSIKLNFNSIFHAINKVFILNNKTHNLPLNFQTYSKEVQLKIIRKKIKRKFYSNARVEDRSFSKSSKAFANFKSIYSF